MRILVVADEECQAYWEYCTPNRLKEFDLIISCGDLKSEYLQFLVTMARCPLLYVHGNHDGNYELFPPEGCDCIDDAIVEYNGIKIMGLGGCRWYHPGKYQYTEAEMQRKIGKLEKTIKRVGGVDLLVTHSPADGLGDGEDPAHRGFTALRTFLSEHHPRWFFHGHVHLRYGNTGPRVREFEGTTIINAGERYILEIPNREPRQGRKNELIWLKKPWEKKKITEWKIDVGDIPTFFDMTNMKM